MKWKYTIAALAMTTMAAQAGTIYLYDADPDSNPATSAPDPSTQGWTEYRVNGGVPTADWGTAGATTGGAQAFVIDDAGPTGKASFNQGGMLAYDIDPSTTAAMNGVGFTLTMNYEAFNDTAGFHGMGSNPDATPLFGRAGTSRWALNGPSTGLHTVVFSWDGTDFSNGGDFVGSSNTHFAGTVEGGMRVFFGDNTVNSSLFNIAITSVTLDSAAVPEPSSTALLGLGGLALLFRRRK